MRATYIIAYDVTDTKRRTRVHKLLKGFGDALQYSLFRCKLTETEKKELQIALWELIHHQQDRLALISLGVVRGTEPIEYWGAPLEPPTPPKQAMII